MSETTFLKIQNILIKYTDVKPENITLDTNLEEIGITSIDIVEIVFDVETEFEIDLLEQEEVEERFNTLKIVRDLVDAIDNLNTEN